MILFGIFLIAAGLLMLLYPSKARDILRKAGSTRLINYAELTIRMIPAAALIVCAELSKIPEIFKPMGWFMIATSLVLLLFLRATHHKFDLFCAEILKTRVLQIDISIFNPFWMPAYLFGELSPSLDHRLRIY